MNISLQQAAYQLLVNRKISMKSSKLPSNKGSAHKSEHNYQSDHSEVLLQSDQTNLRRSRQNLVIKQNLNKSSSNIYKEVKSGEISTRQNNFDSCQKINRRDLQEHLINIRQMKTFQQLIQSQRKMMVSPDKSVSKCQTSQTDRKGINYYSNRGDDSNKKNQTLAKIALPTLIQKITSKSQTDRLKQQSQTELLPPSKQGTKDSVININQLLTQSKRSIGKHKFIDEKQSILQRSTSKFNYTFGQSFEEQKTQLNHSNSSNRVLKGSQQRIVNQLFR